MGTFLAAALIAAACLTALAEEPLRNIPVETVKPNIELSTVFPDVPTRREVMDKGVLAKDSAYFWSDPVGKRGHKPSFKPLADGFTVTLDGSKSDWGRHWLIFENNQIHVADRPIVRTAVTGFSDMYGRHDTFPITGISMEEILPHGTASVNVGTARFAIEANGQAVWLDKYPSIQVFYRPGLAEWRCTNAAQGVDVSLQVRPNISARGFITSLRVISAPASARLMVFYGGVGFNDSANTVKLSGAIAEVTCPQLPRALAYFGLSASDATAKLAPAQALQMADAGAKPTDELAADSTPRCALLTCPISKGRTIYGISVWGADGYDKAKADEVKKRLDPAAIEQPYYDMVWNTWFDNFIGKQLEPEREFRKLLASPQAAWREAESFWAERAKRWTMKTPDAALDASANWVGQTIEYLRQPPGYMVGQLHWNGYGHITTGWHALGAMGDTEKLAILLGTYAGTRKSPSAMFGDLEPGPSNKEIPWVFLNLDTAISEPLNAPFIDHVWNLWQWTGDKGWLRALWPAVRDAIAGEMSNRDPDGDGLYHGFYEFWDCDAEQRGPKAAGETAWMVSGLRAASQMATALGLTKEAAYYREQAQKSLKAYQAQLWYPEIGQAGARTRDGQRYERASIHEVFIGAQRDVLTQKQAAQAFRRLRYLYSQTSLYGVPMMFKNDIWPIIWSQHYMPPGDISLTYMAATKCGLADEYYPYLRTVAASVLKSSHAGMGLSVGKEGVIDSVEVGVSDGCAAFAWSIAEGLFGVAPDGAPDKVRIAPHLPADWPAASASIGAISLKVAQPSALRTAITVSDDQHRHLRIEWPTRYQVKSVTVNGRPAKYVLKPAVDRAVIEVSVKAEKPAVIEYVLHGKEPLRLASVPQDVIAGVPVELEVQSGKAVEVDDPQQCLSAHSFSSDGRSVVLTPRGSGFHTLFVRLVSGELSYWAPVSFRIGPAWEIVERYEAADPPRTAPIKQIWPRLSAKNRTVSVRLSNRQTASMEGPLSLTVAGETSNHHVRIAPGRAADVSAVISDAAWARLLPGAIDLEVEGFGLRHKSKVYAWPGNQNPGAPAFPSPDRLLLLDIDSARNLTPAKMKDVPMPLDFGGSDRLLGWFNSSFKMDPLPSRYEPLPGLHFTLSQAPDNGDGEPMLVLAHAGDPPIGNRARFDIGRKVERAYVLTIFQYYPIKAYSPQAEWVLTYEDGHTESVQWVPPFGTDWALRAESPWTYPVRVGESDNPGWNVPHYYIGTVHAQVIDIPLDATRILKTMEARVTSTESYMAILGVTLVKPE